MDKQSLHPASSAQDSSSMPRREFISVTGSALVAAAGVKFLGVVTRGASTEPVTMPKNIILLITDQERPPMWFPSGWGSVNLPTTARLQKNGLTFTNAFTAAAMCTPSRNTIFTGLFPAQHLSPDTLTEGFQQSTTEHQLDPTLPNLATCLKEAGYDVIFKGKWHMSSKVDFADGEEQYDDISRYGFDQWDAPDAGGDTAPENFGGGWANNDQRFVNDAVSFLQNRLYNPSEKPFCLILSLVNPHDVLAYPKSYGSGGYPDDPWLNPTEPPISLPPTVTEDLGNNKKPTAQKQLLITLQLGLGPLLNDQEKLNYINFYANLMRHVDGQFGSIMGVFDNGGDAGRNLLDNTLIIRTSDHGEMGMCHGVLRQKTFVTYEEALRVPLIWSNPQMFPTARTTSAMVSHVDFLPTLCSFAGVPDWQSKGFKGVDYSSLLLNPEAPPVQDYILFTFDDIYAGQNQKFFPNGVATPPNRIQCIRTKDFKYAYYYDGAGVAAPQEEFYDLRPQGGDYDATFGQPLELNNLSTWAQDKSNLTAEQQAALESLTAGLAAAAATRLQPRTSTPPAGPESIQLKLVNVEDDSGTTQQKVQLTFISRYSVNYQVQQSTDLLTWTNIGGTIPGNNGLVTESYNMPGDRAYYRIQWSPA